MRLIALAVTFALAPGLAQAAESWVRISNLGNQLYAYRPDTVAPATGGVGEVTVVHYDPVGFDYQGRRVRFSVARRKIDCAAWTYGVSSAVLYDNDGGRIVELALNMPPQDSRLLLADKALHRLVCEGRTPSGLETADSLPAAMTQLKAARDDD